MSFAYPWLLLLLPVPLVFLWLRHRNERAMTVAAQWSSLAPHLTRATARTRYARFLPLLRTLALLCLVVALARPRFGEREVEVTTEGVDIVLALDISGSMKAEDFQPHNRLYVAKHAAEEFIEGRENDRIGLVVFASNSFTQCPLTTDYEVLKRLLGEVNFGDVKDGTAIGMGIVNAVNRLKDVPGRSRVVILLTDGQNNAGSVDPITAAELAHSMGVRIYTIGAGSEDEAPYPVDDPLWGRRYVRLPASVDDATLTQVADITGGRYYRATDAEALARIYREIDGMEKTKVETREWVNYSEVGSYLAIPALLLVLAEFLLSFTWLRRLP
ncbi:MAG: VWA domain-containing protein [Candidatus Eisenbacteria bacterium]|nr:VWA domain-containing protein [Candidatus Eisenbacteria bacterium]MCC7144638.1 VWA domain-containing protein [Candidatus Eisenbacteria bacterium]